MCLIFIYIVYVKVCIPVTAASTDSFHFSVLHICTFLTAQKHRKRIFLDVLHQMNNLEAYMMYSPYMVCMLT